MGKRFAAGLLFLWLAVRCGAGLEEPADAAEGAAREALNQDFTFTAAADARVEAVAPGTNFGGTTTLGADASPQLASFLRFDVSGLPRGRVTRAVLRLSVTNGTTDGPRVYPTRSFDESTVTWDARPSRLGTAALADVGSVSAGTSIDIDVIAHVAGNGVFAFELSPASSNGFAAASREASTASARPQLRITLEPEQPSSGTTVRLAPTDDVHVEQASPAANFGASPTLKADLSPAAESYLRFDLSAVSGTLARATLRLYVGDGTADGPRVGTADTAWRESTVTWNSRPAALATLTDLGAVPAGAWLEVDVTSAVRPGAVVAFKLAPTSGDGLDASTKEASTNRPELVLVLGEAQPPPGSCTEDVTVHEVDVEPFQDTYVNADAPTVNYGSANELVSDGSPRQEAYLSFRVEPRPGYRVKSAWLRLNATDDTSNGPKVYRVGAFSEHTVTYATRPATTSAALSDVGAIAAYSFVQYDVSAAVSEGELHFGLLPDSTNGVRFRTRELSHESALLRVTYEATYCARRTPGAATAWVRQYGGTGGEAGSAIAFAPGGEFYLVDYGYNPSGEFGGQAVTGAALVKYAADGTHLWTRALGDVHPREVVVTGLGNVFVVGRYPNAPDLGTGPLPDAGPRAAGMFVAKYGASGALAWARGFVPTSSTYEDVYLYPNAIATDANGSILITGSLLGDVNLGGGTLRGGGIDEYQTLASTLFVVSLRWDGVHQWSREVDVPMNYGASLATDGAGNVWLGGSSRNGMDFGGGPIAAGLFEPFVARFGADGRSQWVRVVSGAGGGVTGIAVPRTADADAFITGAWYGDFRFAGVERSHPYPRGYLGRISASGTERWARQVGNAYETNALELDAQGNAVVLGTATGETDFGTGLLGRAGLEWMPFVATYSPTGEPRWARVFDPNGRWIPAMAVYGMQPLVLMPISGTVFIDRVERRTRGQYDNLLIRLSP